MKQYDFSKLRGRIAEKCRYQSVLADTIGVTEHTISVKLSGKKQFTHSDMVAICEALDIDKADISTYFFTEKV